MTTARTRLHAFVLFYPALLAWPLQQPQASAQGITVQEWEVPWEESRPRDPYVGPDGRVWFVGQRSHYVAYMDPRTEEFKRFDLEDGTGPHTVIVDGQGTPWYAGNLKSHIGTVDPATGAIHKIMMPQEAARDPHTLVFDGEGGIWFTVQAGNFVGHLDMATEDVELVSMPQTEMSSGLTSSRPYGIKLDAAGHPWVALFNTNRIATVDPATMAVRTFDLPEGARPRRLEIAQDGGVWYVDFARGRLAHLDPASGAVQEWLTPGGEMSRPYGTAMDHLGRIWFVEGGVAPARFVGFNPRTEDFLGITEIPSGGGTVRNMYFDQETRSIWFGTDVNTLGRAVVGGDPSP